jgi:hypothetical protein
VQQKAFLLLARLQMQPLATLLPAQLLVQQKMTLSPGHPCLLWLQVHMPPPGCHLQDLSGKQHHWQHQCLQQRLLPPMLLL